MKEIQLNPQQLEAISHRDGPMVALSLETIRRLRYRDMEEKSVKIVVNLTGT